MPERERNLERSGDPAGIISSPPELPVNPTGANRRRNDATGNLRKTLLKLLPEFPPNRNVPPSPAAARSSCMVSSPSSFARTDAVSLPGDGRANRDGFTSIGTPVQSPFPRLPGNGSHPDRGRKAAEPASRFRSRFAYDCEHDRPGTDSSMDALTHHRPRYRLTP